MEENEKTLYSKIEHLIIMWSNDGTKTAGSLTRQIMKLLNEKNSEQLSSGSLEDTQEIIEFLQWVFRKIDKGDNPEETVRLLLMNREKIDNIKLDSLPTQNNNI
jgi:hypothetical protein